MSYDQSMSNMILPAHTRSIEDSISHGHDAISRAEQMIDMMLGELNGPEGADNCPPKGPYPGGGIVASADILAGRIEGLARELERIRHRLVADSPKAPRPPVTFGAAVSRGC